MNVEWSHCVDEDLGKCGGAPVIQGTRFTVARLLVELALGQDIENVAEHYGVPKAKLEATLLALANSLR